MKWPTGCWQQNKIMIKQTNKITQGNMVSLFTGLSDSTLLSPTSTTVAILSQGRCPGWAIVRPRGQNLCSQLDNPLFVAGLMCRVLPYGGIAEPATRNPRAFQISSWTRSLFMMTQFRYFHAIPFPPTFTIQDVNYSSWWGCCLHNTSDTFLSKKKFQISWQRFISRWVWK